MTTQPAATAAQRSPECTCGASIDGKWADVHDARCPVVAHVKSEQELVDSAWERHKAAAPSAACITAMDAAYADFLLAMKRPRPLRALNSRADIVDRVVALEERALAFAKFFQADIEDISQHVNLARRTSDYAVAVLSDLASDVRGELVQAIDGVVTAARAG